MKKCPPGVICFENVTIFFIILILILIFYFYFNSHKNYANTNTNTNFSHSRNHTNSRNSEILISQVPNYPYNNIFAPPPVPGDVLLNPYVHPLRDDLIWSLDKIELQNPSPYRIKYWRYNENKLQIEFEDEKLLYSTIIWLPFISTISSSTKLEGIKISVDEELQI